MVFIRQVTVNKNTVHKVSKYVLEGKNRIMSWISLINLKYWIFKKVENEKILGFIENEFYSCQYFNNRIEQSLLYVIQRRRQDFGSGGGTFWGIGLVGGPGAEPPDAGEFAKIFKKFLKKIANNALF